MPNQELLLHGLHHSCYPVSKSGVDLDGWPEEEPIDLGVRPIKKPSRRKGASPTSARQKAEQKDGRGQRDMRFR